MKKFIVIMLVSLVAVASVFANGDTDSATVSTDDG